MYWGEIQEVPLTGLNYGLTLGAQEERSVKVDSQVPGVDFAERQFIWGAYINYILDNFNISKQKHQEGNGICKVSSE